MIWQPAFALFAAFIFFLAVAPVCNMVRYMLNDLSSDGVMFQPTLELASLWVSLMAFRALGSTDDFSLIGGVLVPFAASSVAFTAFVLCCPLASVISPREDIDADYDRLDPARAQRRARRMN